MLGPARILLAAVFLIGLAWALVRSLRSYLRYKNQMVVTCPETDRQVGVSVDARRAAIKGVLGSGPLRLSDCARWPEKQACGQECLSQIEASPETCMIRKRIEGWYQGKACACCDKEILEIHWHEHKPALLSPERRLLQWENVAAEEMAQVLCTHEPVCGTCNFAEKW